MVKKFSSGIDPSEGSAESKPAAPNQTANASRRDAALPDSAVRPIINPYAKRPPEPEAATVIRALPAANAPANPPIVNPYAKSGNARASAQLPDAFKMMMDPKYREFHQRPVRNTEPPMPYPGTKAEKPIDQGEQYFLSSGSDPKLTMKKYLKDAYFKVDNFNYVTADKHQELLKAKGSKIRPPEDLSAHNVVLLSDRTRTMLVSPQKLAELDEQFAAKKLKGLNIGQKALDMNPAGKTRHEILILSPKNDHVFALANQTGNRKYKPHQVFVAVDEEQGRHYVDLRSLIADKKIPPLSKDAQSQLKHAVEPDTRAALSKLMAGQQPIDAGAKRSNAVLNLDRPNGESTQAPPAPKRFKSDLDDRSRDISGGRNL